MSAFFLWLFEQIGLAALKRWWGGRKPIQQVEDEHALEAKTEEAKALAAPPLDKPAIVLSMQHRLDDTRP